MRYEAKAHKGIYAAALAATVARVVLAALTPVRCVTYAGYDDGLMLGYAQSLAGGAWLGQYTRFTLVKNPGYAMILAFSAFAHIRYQVVFMLLWAVACAVAARALEPLVRDARVRLGIYLALLWTPVFFMYEFFERTYRSGIVMPFVLGIFAGYFGLYLRRDRPARQLAPWAVLAGLTLAYFYLIMESSAWVLPFVIVCSLVLCILWVLDLRQGRLALRGLAARLLLLALPLAMLWGWTSLEAKANGHFYGIRLNNVRTQGSYSQVLGRLASIDTGETNPDIVISRAALEQAFAASPTFAQAQDTVWTSWDTWAAGYTSWDKPEGSKEVPGDIGFWALMDGYEAAFGYANPQDPERFWAQVCGELDAAFADGRLQHKPGLALSPGTQPVTAADVAPWLAESLASGGRIALYQPDTRMVGFYPVEEKGDAAVIQAQLRARDFLGGNSTVDDPGDALYIRTRGFVAAEAAVGHALLWVYRALALASVVAAAWLVYQDKKDVNEKNLDGRRTALLVAALLLSAFALIAGVVWAEGFFMRQDPQLHGLSVSMYAGASYILFAYAECILVGRAVGRLKAAGESD